MFALTDAHLRRLCALNGFEFPKSEMIFFGLRGCLPVNEEENGFAVSHGLKTIDVDHEHLRCTMGQWLPKEKTLAVFAASTTPHKQYLKTAMKKSGAGANELMTGFYLDYRKGVHKPASRTAHEAFRQLSFRPIRRTADDFDFDNDDRVEFKNPNDNLHAAWSRGTSHAYYASAGCQVIAGYPKCKKRGTQPATGAWKVFQESAYGLEQNQFCYLLLNGAEAERVAASQQPDGKYSPASVWLRFGSSGKAVEELQAALKKKGFYEGKKDGDFGGRTLRAVMDFQTATLGKTADDGIVGAKTAGKLNLKLPTL